MDEERGTVVQTSDQVLPPTVETGNLASEQQVGAGQAAWAHDLGEGIAMDGGDQSTGDARFERAPDGLDLGEFWHGGSMIEHGGGRGVERGREQTMTGTSQSTVADEVGRFDPDCVFCRIVRGDFGTTFLAESEHGVAFADISPQAPVHVLIVPRDHVADLSAVTIADEPLLGELLGLARRVAHERGLDERGYRVLTNVGPDAGQSVFHLHLHVLGGRPLGVGLG